MIKKLKYKFIILSSVSLFVLLTVIITGMNIINYKSIITEAETILSILSENDGVFPENKGEIDKPPLPPGMSPELPHESRYFSVVLSNSGDVISSQTERIASIDEDAAVKYAKNVFEQKNTSGFIEKFRYNCHSLQNGNLRITFLDFGRKLDSFKNFLYISILISSLGLALFILIISFFAEKIVRPIALSYEKQKRFITDAGHELKTPLTIINANADILELEIGENEYLRDIKQQTKRLSSLTNDLVYLAKIEESENKIQKIDFPVSELVLETANSFRMLINSQNKTLSCDIQPMLTLNGDYKSIEQLVYILIDNAIKYSPESTDISVSLAKHGKVLQLIVKNTVTDDIYNQDLSRIFDRFYRIDPSRNSQSGGHGIGLSIANAITQAHNGKIQAHFEDNCFTINVTLPI